MLEVLLDTKLMHSLAVIIGFSFIYFVVNKIVKRMLKIKSKKLMDKKQKTVISLINNITKYFLIIVGIITILSINGFDTSSLIASLGVASAVVALAFQDTLKDLFAGVFIVFENQYNIGDTVKINDFKGEVISVGLRTTKLKAYTGEYAFISNRTINSVINYSMSKSLAIVNVDVAYEEDLNKVNKVLEKLFMKLQDEIIDIKGEIVIDGVDNLGESGVTIRITAPTTPLKNFEVERKLRKEIKCEFDRVGITIPYNQVVIHNGL
ncbi:MAG: mechanosensitive ion channel family protein [Bacilli bacterium]|nr:mechanosensitive ion channel family protein [Bacilli bacterium]